MNDFDYTIKLQQIKDCKTLACAKNFIVESYGKANYHYRDSYTDTYYPYGNLSANINDITEKMNYFNLFIKAREKYLTLGGSINRLPAYADSNSFDVNINMPFKKAYELLITGKLGL